MRKWVAWMEHILDAKETFEYQVFDNENEHCRQGDRTQFWVQ